MRSRLATLLLLSFTLVACKRVEAPAAHSLKLAERVRDRVRQLYPKLTVTILDDTAVEVKAGDFNLKLYLDNLKLACQKDEEACTAMMENLVGNLNQAYAARADAKKPAERSSIRLTIKPQDWVANVVHMIEESPVDMRGSNEMVTAPFTGGLTIVYVIDMPKGIRMLTTGDLEELKLDRKQVDALARANLQEAFPKVKMSEMEHTGVWTNDDGNDYDAALIALPQLWKPLADQLGGLVVSIPARNRVFAAGAKGNLAGLRKITKMAAADEPHGISDQLFVWSARGFSPLPR